VLVRLQHGPVADADLFLPQLRVDRESVGGEGPGYRLGELGVTGRDVDEDIGVFEHRGQSTWVASIRPNHYDDGGDAS